MAANVVFFTKGAVGCRGLEKDFRGLSVTRVENLLITHNRFFNSCFSTNFSTKCRKKVFNTLGFINRNCHKKDEKIDNATHSN